MERINFVEKVGLSLEWKSEGVMDGESRVMREMGWLVNEEVNRDKSDEADGMNLEVDSKDEVMHI